MFVRKLKLYLYSLFEKMSNFHSRSLLNQVSKIEKENYFEYHLQSTFRNNLNFGLEGPLWYFFEIFRLFVLAFRSEKCTKNYIIKTQFVYFILLTLILENLQNSRARSNVLFEFERTIEFHGQISGHVS